MSAACVGVYMAVKRLRGQVQRGAVLTLALEFAESAEDNLLNDGGDMVYDR